MIFSHDNTVEQHYVNKSSKRKPDRRLDTWIELVDDLGITINVIGLLANCFLLVMISKSKCLNKKVKLIMRHQVTIDALIALISIPKLAQHDMLEVELAHDGPGERIICYLWTSKMAFWTLVCVSVYGIILQSVDRYIAIRFAAYYRTMKLTGYIVALISFYLIAILVNSLVFLNTVDYQGGSCRIIDDHQSVGFVRQNFFKLMIIIWLSSIYFIPIILLGFFHTLSLHRFYSGSVRVSSNSTNFSWTRGGSQTNSDPCMIEQIGSQLLKSSLAISLCYVVSFSLDTVFISICLFNLVDMNDITNPVNRIGSLLLNVNTISPFLYCLILPALRREVVTMISWRGKNQRRTRVQEFSLEEHNSNVTNSKAPPLPNSSCV